MRQRLEEAEAREKAYVKSQKKMYEKLASSRSETTTPRNTTTGKTPFTPTTKDIHAPVSYQRRREEQQQAKMAESAASLLREEEDDEFQGILGMRLDLEMDSDKDVMSSPTTLWPPAAFPAVLPARRNPDTVYPASGERNRPRGGTKDFNMMTWVEDTTVVMTVKQMCEKSEAFRRELFRTLTPNRPQPEPQEEDLPRPPIQRRPRQPVVESDEELEEPVMREPVMREPVMRGPVRREPVMREPVRREPVMREPVMTEPVTRYREQEEEQENGDDEDDDLEERIVERPRT